MTEASSPLPATRALVLDRWRVLYVVTPKAMCTSLLWALGRLNGETFSGVVTSGSAEVTRSMAVHDPAVWRHTVTAHELAPELLREVVDGDGWFRFALTRHPVDRLWSAWQSKLLMREPAYAAKYSAAPWFPRDPAGLPDGDLGMEAIANDFAAFVAALDEPELLMADQHWAPQVALLRPTEFRYTMVGRVEEADEVLIALETHLARQGHDRPLTIPRRNTGLLRRQNVLRDGALLRRIEALYANDMEAFSYPPAEAGFTQSADVPAIRALAEITERHERIADLHRELHRASGDAVRTSSRRRARPSISLIVRGGPVPRHVSPSTEVVVATSSGGLEDASGDIVVLGRGIKGITSGWEDEVRDAFTDSEVALACATVEPDHQEVDQPHPAPPDSVACDWSALASVLSPATPSGAFLAVRSATLTYLGGLDPRLRTARWHDLELCLRAWRCGLKTVHLPRIQVVADVAQASVDADAVHDMLRLTAMHADARAFADLIADLRQRPDMIRALAAVLCSDAGLRRSRLERIALRDGAALFRPPRATEQGTEVA